VDSTHDAIVYDLDGTLVRLAVDWAAVRRSVVDVLEAGGTNPGGADLWSMLDIADAAGLADEVETTIAEFERAGARESERLPLADDLPQDRPVGVCSLNCVDACEIALDTHGLAAHVDAVVGRDSLPEQKPDPEPLLAVLERLDAEPSRSLFVGDSDSDAETARAAGVDFEFVSDR
jgi:phosphoglycolate phosphatase